MNLVFSLGLLVAGGILMYAGVKGEPLSQVMSDLNTFRINGKTSEAAAGGTTPASTNPKGQVPTSSGYGVGQRGK